MFVVDGDSGRPRSGKRELGTGRQGRRSGARAGVRERREPPILAGPTCQKRPCVEGAKVTDDRAYSRGGSPNCASGRLCTVHAKSVLGRSRRSLPSVPAFHSGIGRPSISARAAVRGGVTFRRLTGRLRWRPAEYPSSGKTDPLPARVRLAQERRGAADTVARIGGACREAHLDHFPAVPVTSPREDSASRDLVTVRLLFTGLRVRRWTEWTSTSECGVRPWPVRASTYRYARPASLPVRAGHAIDDLLDGPDRLDAQRRPRRANDLLMPSSMVEALTGQRSGAGSAVRACRSRSRRLFHQLIDWLITRIRMTAATTPSHGSAKIDPPATPMPA
jgi:hypothetical protein